MPLPFLYSRGQVVTLRATVVLASDSGNPIVNIGGALVPIPRAALDKADVRGDAERPNTQEELDLIRIREAQDVKAAAQAEQEAAAERARVVEGEQLLEQAKAAVG